MIPSLRRHPHTTPYWVDLYPISTYYPISIHIYMPTYLYTIPLCGARRIRTYGQSTRGNASARCSTCPLRRLWSSIRTSSRSCPSILSTRGRRRAVAKAAGASRGNGRHSAVRRSAYQNYIRRSEHQNRTSAVTMLCHCQNVCCRVIICRPYPNAVCTYMSVGSCVIACHARKQRAAALAHAISSLLAHGTRHVDG